MYIYEHIRIHINMHTCISYSPSRVTTGVPMQYLAVNFNNLTLIYVYVHIHIHIYINMHICISYSPSRVTTGVPIQYLAVNFNNLTLPKPSSERIAFPRVIDLKKKNIHLNTCIYLIRAYKKTYIYIHKYI
jgi:hypothetical protein